MIILLVYQKFSISDNVVTSGEQLIIMRVSEKN